MEIVKLENFDWLESSKQPFKGKFIMTGDTHQVSYIDRQGLSWSLSSADYEYFEQWYKEQEAGKHSLAARTEAMPKMDPPPRGLTPNGTGIILNNCSAITINGAKT